MRRGILMKRSNILIWFLLVGLLYISNAHLQEINDETDQTYNLKEDILYRDKNAPEWNDYIEERCRLDIYYPIDKPDFATVVWFHGGGLKAGNRFIPEQLKNQNIAVVSVNYRLYPKVKCPVYIEDAAAAVSWVFKNIKQYGGDPDLIFISGHSAGGYLTSMIGLDKRWLAVHNIDANRIAGLIPYSGHTITHFTVREERGIPGERPIVDELAPLFHIGSDAPPLVLITGDRNLELLGRYEENAYMMRMMKVVDHKSTYLYEIQGYNHGDMAAPAHAILLDHIRPIIEEKQK